ncbi:MAG TPA: nucleoside-diphosphate sugar epimerase/dehydratase [Acidiferrobacterales bacterium]|nr:nucleoside-diphosphate sugar epimerase/dehydratase [Acidiferrobacterales bacterium]
MNRIFNKLRTRPAIFLLDLSMIPIAWMGAYWLRFNLSAIPESFVNQAISVLPLILIIQGSVFWYFGLYRGVWRFASIPDLIRIFKAVFVGVTLAAVAIFFLTRLANTPRSVFILDGFLLIFLLGGPRFVYRWLKDHYLNNQSGKKVLIVGAGQAGEMLARDLLRNQERMYLPVAFVDDDRVRIGKEIHGIPVISSCDAIPQIVGKLNIDIILIAITTATSKQIQRILNFCEASKIPVRILPRMQDLVDGQVSIKELRDVKIEDLLGRESVSLDWRAITKGCKGKSILVTGGGGSIGSELCRQLARLKPARLIVFERCEFNLYTIELELRREFPQLELIALLGDVCDPITVEHALHHYRPQVIFHAAAYKHVPMLEDQVRAAVNNNILGTQILASFADRYACKVFVMISTDKAVNPGNVMGTTKRVAEIYCQNLNARSNTRFITVRFGNVLGSAGSVIPLFQKQIAAGGPVTVTHPEITRYFMTIPEACQLILQASVIGQGGEIYVLDMGEPVKIAYLAEQLILLSGKKPGEDIEIVYTGLRAGEKLYEELFHEGEKLIATAHPKILLAASRQVDKNILERMFRALGKACRSNDEPKLKELLHKLVPEVTGVNLKSEMQSSTESGAVYH